MISTLQLPRRLSPFRWDGKSLEKKGRYRVDQHGHGMGGNVKSVEDHCCLALLTTLRVCVCIVTVARIRQDLR
jgi:hypothetical protein